MKKHTKTIQSNLFFTYSIIILIVALVFVSYFYTWSSNQLKEEAFSSLDNISGSVSQKLDSEIEKMDSVSLSIMYSNLVKDRFEKYVRYTGDSDCTVSSTEEIEMNTNNKELIDVITAIVGPSRPVQQIYLYDLNGKMFGTGFDNRQLKVNVSGKVWYDEVLKRNGEKYISLPYNDKELSKMSLSNNDSYYISLCRLYSDYFNRPQGILEVIQNYDEIFSTIDDTVNKISPHENIFVYNDSGELVYPHSDVPKQDYNYYYKLAVNNLKSKGYFTIKGPKTKYNELLSYNTSDYTGWTVITIVSEKQLLKPIMEFTETTMLVVFAILIFALFLSYIAAKKITNPIANLHKSIKALNWDAISSSVPGELNSGLNELEDLNSAFQKMNIKLRKSMEELLLSEANEMQAKMLAFQSQMNPHFLYNSLATLGAMAEENMDEQIIEMCENLSDMLRYISSDSSLLVNMKAEIEYTEKYLACMKIRHKDKLIYSINIDDYMREINIPKLVIQPLVENSLKYGTVNAPPWNIKIYGETSGDMWKITVEDDGPGFSDEDFQFISSKISEINDTKIFPSLKLDGMGILNIFIRLKLSYGNHMKFEIVNNPSGGASITIGGIICK